MSGIASAALLVTALVAENLVALFGEIVLIDVTACLYPARRRI
ncbi:MULTISPECIES: hypothetical protein [Amycolatopsis]|nr:MULTISPECIES: hypothetical protein [Amycolatopsis]OAP20855.1 hypothetical protein A4R44_08300 [Amycolatopsis sp. M39]